MMVQHSMMNTLQLFYWLKYKTGIFALFTFRCTEFILLLKDQNRQLISSHSLLYVVYWHRSHCSNNWPSAVAVKTKVVHESEQQRQQQRQQPSCRKYWFLLLSPFLRVNVSVSADSMRFLKAFTVTTSFMSTKTSVVHTNCITDRVSFFPMQQMQ